MLLVVMASTLVAMTSNPSSFLLLVCETIQKKTSRLWILILVSTVLGGRITLGFWCFPGNEQLDSTAAPGTHQQFETLDWQVYVEGLQKLFDDNKVLVAK